MRNTPDFQDLPEDDHLLQDIGGTDTSPQDEDPSGTPAEFTGDHYTAGQLNAGQQVAGASPGGSGADQSRGKDLKERARDAGSNG